MCNLDLLILRVAIVVFILVVLWRAGSWIISGCKALHEFMKKVTSK